MTISFVLTLLASVSAFISAWYWYKSSRIKYDPSQLDANVGVAQEKPRKAPTTGVFIMGHPAATTSDVDAATIENSKKIAAHSQELNAQIAKFVTDNSSLNAKASLGTACAAFLGAMAAILNNFGY